MASENEKRCPVCGEYVEREFPFPLFDGTGRTEPRIVRVQCKCRRAEMQAMEKRLKHEEEQRNISALRGISLMDAKLRNVRFATYKVNEKNEKAYRIAQKYVLNFNAMLKAGQGLLFWGDVGTGKSYTAAAIANELLENQISVVMTSFVKIVDELGGFDTDNASYINQLNSAKLLVIDDLGAERGTDYALEKVYDIIDSRYRSGKPIILTTNLTFSEMKCCTDIRYSRIYDRIFEMCYPVKFEGLSWRKKDAAEKFGEMKKILEG